MENRYIAVVIGKKYGIVFPYQSGLEDDTIAQLRKKAKDDDRVKIVYEGTDLSNAKCSVAGLKNGTSLVDIVLGHVFYF